MPQHFPDWIKTYCDMLDGKTEAPRRFHFWSAVSCIGGTLTRKVVFDEVAFRYYPNFYIILVSPPGIVKKTSTIDLAFDFLRRLEDEVGHVKIGPDITTMEGLCNYIATINKEITTSNNSDMMQVGTEWALQCACTLAIGEFGNLYSQENTSLINVLTDLYDCRDVPLWKHTKTQGDDKIINPFVNIIAGTTPQFLQDEFRKKVAGWGLSSRIIFVAAERKERHIYSPSRYLCGDVYNETRLRLYEDMKQIALLAGKMTLTDEAYAWGEQWYARSEHANEEYVAQDNYSEWVAHFRGRKHVHVHKLAMVLSAARRDTLRVTIEDLRDAAAHIEEIERDLPRAFARRMEPSAAAETEQQLISKILVLLANGPMQRSEVMTRAAQFVDSLTAGRLIESAIARRILTQEVKGVTGTWLRNGHAPEEE